MKRKTSLILAMVLAVSLLSSVAHADTVWVDSATALYTLNPTNGTTTLVGSFNVSNATFSDIAFDGSILWGITTEGNLYKINTTTGQATLAGPTGILPGSQNALEAIGGVLWVARNANNAVYTIANPGSNTTAVPTPGNLGSGVSSSGDLAYNPITGLLYLTANDPNHTGDTLYTIQTAGASQGAGTAVGTGIGRDLVYGIDFLSDDTLLAVTSAGEVFTINTVTGSGIFPGPGSTNFTPVNGMSAIPLPASVLLLGTGLLGLMGWRRFRKG